MDNLVNVDENGLIQLLPGDDSGLPSLIVAGDLCPVGQCEKLLSNGLADSLFPEVAGIIKSADLAIANLECPLTNQGTPIIKSGPHLRADPACARGIRAAGFDIVSLANNHILDMGGQGLADTQSACIAAGLKTVGAGQNLSQAARTLWVEAQGVRVAILTFAENEFSTATADTPGAWPVDPIGNHYQIQQAKQEADFVLVLVHGGNEYDELPGPALVKLCRYFVDLGANAVISNHVHVPGGMEVYQGSPIIYSSGNFLFEGKNQVEGWYQGFLVKLTIQPLAVVSLQLIPYWQSKDGVGVRLMDDCARSEFLARFSTLCAVIANPAALTERWNSFVGARRIQYLCALLGLTRVERRLLRMGVWPFWRLKRSAGAGLLNLFRCESHRDLTISLLSSEFLSSGSEIKHLV